MDNKTQVNINRNNRNRIPPWAWGSIAAATLALILGYLLFFNRPQSQPAVTPTMTPTMTPTVTSTIAVLEVTSTPNLLTPTSTPLTVEVTPTPGTPTPAGPTATVVVIEVTSTPGPPTVTPPARATTAATATQATTAPASIPTTTGQTTPAATGAAVPSPQATLTANEQTVMDALRGAANGDRVSTVRYDGTNLTVDFQLVDGATTATAREQVRAMLLALSQNTLGYSKLMMRGMTQTSGQDPPIQLTYDQTVVSTIDWATVPAADVYGKAEARTLQPPFDTP